MCGLDVLMDIPATAGLEKLVQVLKVLFLVGDAAETADANNAIEAALWDLAVPGRRVSHLLNADGDDFVDAI